MSGPFSLYSYQMFRNYPTVHCHQGSLDSASTPEEFLKRELELGTGTLTVTDHGVLSSCRKVYSLAKKAGITPALGLEAYLRDDNCPILTSSGISKGENGTFANYCKYYHVTLHFLDQQALECGIRLLSKADSRAERHGSERKPLFSWADLEELGAQNTTMTSSCLIGAVSRHLLDHNDLGMAIKHYEKMRSLVGKNRFFVEIFPHDCSENWVSGVFLTLRDKDGKEEKIKYHSKKNIKTNAGEIYVSELARGFKVKSNSHRELLAIKNYTVWTEVEPKTIVNAEHIEGFVKNECRPVLSPSGDIQLGVNKVMIALANKYGDPCTPSDDCHFASKEAKIVQDCRLAQSGNWRFSESYHRQSSEESFAFFKKTLNTSERQFESWVDNAYMWADQFKNFELKSEVSLPVKVFQECYEVHSWSKTSEPSDHSLLYLRELIKKHGRMDWSDPKRVERLSTEIKLFKDNGTIDLLPYFFLGEEVCDVYSKLGLITGPGRGSSAGCLIAFLLGITHIDPIRFDLSLDRFLTLDRIQSGKLPDIDLDLPDRAPLTTPETGWLHKRFGDCFAQLSVNTTLRLKSSIRDVSRFIHGFVSPEIEEWTKTMLLPPQGVNDIDFIMGYETDEGSVPGSLESDKSLIAYVQKYPQEWEVVKKALGLSRSAGRHASAFIISDRPVNEFIPTTTINDVRCTAYDATGVEESGGLKMDFLVVSALLDISYALKLIRERSAIQVPKEGTRINGVHVPFHRILPFNGELLDVYDLPADVNVFGDIVNSRTETVFQFNTPGAQKLLKHFNFKKKDGTYGIASVDDLATFTALDRPGPLDMYVRSPEDESGETKHNMLVEYARRVQGKDHSPDVNPATDALLPDTQGIIIFQESLQYVYQNLTGCTGPEAESFRSDVAKKKKSKIDAAYSFFMPRAELKLGSKDEAQNVWNSLRTFAKYGFCIAGNQGVLTSVGNVPIADLNSDHRVAYLSKNGNIEFEPPTSIWQSGNKEVFEITLEDGSIVTATGDHQFLYDGQWVQLKDLILIGSMEVATDCPEVNQKLFVNVETA